MYDESQDRELPEVEFTGLPGESRLPGLEKLISKGEVTIFFTFNLEIDKYLKFGKGKFQEQLGDFQISSSFESEPYSVQNVLGSDVELARFICRYLQMVIDDREGNND